MDAILAILIDLLDVFGLSWAGLRESCVFVFNNIWNEPDEIEVDEIPGRGALRLLSMAQGAGYAAFLQFYQKSVSEKVSPSSSESASSGSVEVVMTSSPT